VTPSGAVNGSGTLIIDDLAMRNHVSDHQRRMEPQRIDAFDLTQAMLEQFQAELDASGVILVRLKQANVLALGQLPSSWSDYDLIVSASMLEHLAKEDLSQAVSALRGRLSKNGISLAIVTRKNWIQRSSSNGGGTRQDTRAKSFGKLLRPAGSVILYSSSFLLDTSG